MITLPLGARVTEGTVCLTVKILFSGPGQGAYLISGTGRDGTIPENART